MTAALETQGLGLDFGGVRAADGVSLSLAPGARAALIGPNGAGKTTLVNLLSGALRPARGRILMGGRDVTRAGPAARAQAGLSRSFQVAQLFPTLTPAESVALAIRARRGRQDAAARAAETEALLGQFALTKVAHRPAGQLGYGQQRLVELAIALAGGPSVLLLDEPAAGLAEAERHALRATLAALPRSVSVLLVEHDMDLVFAFAERIAVMAAGRIIADGPPDAIAADPAVRAVYLGEAADA